MNQGPAMAGRKHIIALESAIRAAGDRLGDTDKPLLELCRTLARQMDTEGAAASTRLTAAYLSALKDLHRTLADSKPAGAKLSKLDELKKRRAARGA